MRRVLSLFAIILAFFYLSSCTNKDNTQPEEYYTAAQKEALSVFKGTFKEDLYGVITTYTFLEQYDSFKEVECYGFSGDSKSKTIVHGKCRLTYWNGDSYDLYYFMNKTADNIAFYSDRIHAEAYELKIVSPTEFWLRQENPSWNKYIKQ